jgi:hypothetical protein
MSTSTLLVGPATGGVAREPRTAFVLSGGEGAVPMTSALAPTRSFRESPCSRSRPPAPGGRTIKTFGAQVRSRESP